MNRNVSSPGRSESRVRRGAQGLTFIEVVVSVAMLALISAALMGSLSFMETAAARERHRLHATEVAHRVIAQYLDNSEEPVIKENLPIQQGDSVYRWTLEEEVLVQEDTGAKNLGRRVGKAVGTLTAEEQLPAMLNRITVRVWLADETPHLDTVEPMAEMVRIFNPISGRPEEEVLRTLLKLVEQAQREQAERQRKGGAAPGKGAGHP